MSVYFIQAGEGGPVKIGQTKDCKKRLADLQCSNAENLRLINDLPGSFAEEGEAHQIFKALRIRGEWFQFHPRMLCSDLDLSGSDRVDTATTLLFQADLPLPSPAIVADETLVGWARVARRKDANRAAHELLVARCHPELTFIDIGNPPSMGSIPTVLKFLCRGATLVLRSWRDVRDQEMRRRIEGRLSRDDIGLRVLNP